MGKPIQSLAWCAESTYPGAAGLPFSWSGTATATAPSPDYFTPKTRPPAQPLNYLFQQSLATIQQAFGWTGNMAAQNWYAEQGLLSGMIYNTAIAWDPVLSKWIIACFSGGASYILVSYGLDGSNAPGWTLLSGSAIAVTHTSSSLCDDPTGINQYWWTYVNDDGTNNGTIIFKKFNGTSWSTADTLGIQSSGTNIQKPRMIVFQGDIVAAIGNNFGGHATNINPIVKKVTTSFQLVDPGVAANDFLLGITPGNVLVVVPAFTAGSVTFGNYVLTLDGNTFTDIGMTIIGPNDEIVGLCSTQDITGPCLLLAVFNTVTLTTRFYRTGDGIVWTTQSTPRTIMGVADMAACGSLVVATLQDASSTGPSGQIWSPDGGVTWYFGQSTFTSNDSQASAPYERSRVVASGMGFMAMNNLWLRFSLLQGTPPSTL